MGSRPTVGLANERVRASATIAAARCGDRNEVVNQRCAVPFSVRQCSGRILLSASAVAPVGGDELELALGMGSGAQSVMVQTSTPGANGFDRRATPSHRPIATCRAQRATAPSSRRTVWSPRRRRIELSVGRSGSQRRVHSTRGGRRWPASCVRRSRSSGRLATGRNR